MLRSLCFSALMLGALPVMAQNSQPTSPTTPTVPVQPPSAVAPPERIAPPAGSLSDQMSQQKGTIAPPNVDPGMAVNPPHSGTATTPVIPPPGSPGGNPTVIPK